MNPNYLIFYLGAIFGSHGSVIYSRFLIRRSVVNERSQCDFCRSTLGIIDLIPILSFILLRGKCRRCHQYFGLFYLFFELITGLLFWLVYSNYGISAIGFYILAIYTAPLIYMDFKFMRLPNTWVAFCFIGMIANYAQMFIMEKINVDTIKLGAISFGLTSVFYLSIYILSRGRGIGFGDVKLAPVLVAFAAISSWQRGFVAFISGLILAGILAIPLYIFRLVNRKTAIPLGPFLIVGSWLAILLPTNLVDKFLSLWLL